jgi:hypothetical protein
MLLVKAHAAFGVLALALIAGFWLTTVGSELAGSAEHVVLVKTWILRLIPVLVALMAGAGAAGNLIARGRKTREIGDKRLRAIVAALNGLLILIPCAYVLEGWAVTGEFTARFYGVQAIELAAGAGNIVLLALNLRDGLRLRAMRKGRNA